MTKLKLKSSAEIREIKYSHQEGIRESLKHYAANAILPVTEALEQAQSERDGLHELHNKNAASSAELLELCNSYEQQLTSSQQRVRELEKALADIMGGFQPDHSLQVLERRRFEAARKLTSPTQPGKEGV